MNPCAAIATRLLGLVILALLAGCVNQSVKSTSVPAVKVSEAQLPEDQLLDVGISIFDPGIDDADDDDDFMYPEVRRAEALYMPYLLLQAIESSGAWGPVRLVPDNSQLVDLMVSGTIEQSHGEELRIHMTATDATGLVWLDKPYEAHASRFAYDTRTRTRLDPFQIIYNRVANDLLIELQKRNSDDLSTIRTVNELRFAGNFSPDAFNDHLEVNRKGIYTIKRLPAADDPMLERVRKIRERDYLFIDTLQDYYASFNGQMGAPYQEWRKLSYEEAMALQELRAQSQRQLIAGIAAIIGGVAASGGGDSRTTRVAGDVAIAGGAMLVKSGLNKRAEAEIHVEALEELSLSLEAEIAPQVIELEDSTVTLSGNVEDQYQQWRELLKQIYEAEVGDLQPLPAEEDS